MSRNNGGWDGFNLRFHQLAGEVQDHRFFADDALSRQLAGEELAKRYGDVCQRSFENDDE